MCRVKDIAMKKSGNKIFIILVLIFCWNISSNAFEKVGTTSFQFLKVYPGARASAMSGAFCTVADNSEAVFWNPAALTRVQGFDASVNYIGWLLDIKHYALSAAYNMGDWGTIGLSGIITDVGNIEETVVSNIGNRGLVDGVYDPGLTGRVFRPSSSVLGISYAEKLTSRFSFGLTMKYVRDDLIYSQADGLIFDGGFLFDTEYRSIVIGASIRHFGADVKYVNKKYPLPQTFNVGISAEIFSSTNPLLFKVEDQKLLMSYDIVQPRDYTQMHSLGMEYSYKDMVFLRTGYTFNSSQEGLSAGFGICFQGGRIDYSYSDFGQYLGSVQRITIGFGLN